MKRILGAALAFHSIRRCTVASGALILLACAWLSAVYAQPVADVNGAFSVSELLGDPYC
jgi:hypothetical protein